MEVAGLPAPSGTGTAPPGARTNLADGSTVENGKTFVVVKIVSANALNPSGNHRGLANVTPPVRLVEPVPQTVSRPVGGKKAPGP